MPEFGDRFENPVASADNPNQIGMFVRKVLRSGRVMNPGLFYEMTDGKGEFWLIKPDNLIPLDLPPRVQAAEDRQRFRDMLAKSSLGEPDVVAAVEQFRREREALPDRWVSLRRVDFIGLIELYRERREVHNEDHDDALDHLLAEVDFEPNQDDLFDRRNRLD